MIFALEVISLTVAVLVALLVGLVVVGLALGLGGQWWGLASAGPAAALGTGAGAVVKVAGERVLGWVERRRG